MESKAIKALVAQRVVHTLAKYEYNRNIRAESSARNGNKNRRRSSSNANNGRGHRPTLTKTS